MAAANRYGLRSNTVLQDENFLEDLLTGEVSGDLHSDFGSDSGSDLDCSGTVAAINLETSQTENPHTNTVNLDTSFGEKLPGKPSTSTVNFDTSTRKGVIHDSSSAGQWALNKL